MSTAAVHTSTWDKLLKGLNLYMRLSTYNHRCAKGDICQVAIVLSEVWDPFDTTNDCNCGCDNHSHYGKDPRRKSQQELLGQGVDAVVEEGLYKMRAASYHEINAKLELWTRGIHGL
jgi:hypothetical protein